ncbi:MAG: N-acetylglucosamine repressor [Actinomycetota bacterium]|jgi:predicted NBD/HSP70 family sugar kinase
MVRKPATDQQSIGRNREAVRQHNLSAVLRLVHQHGEISRSQITQITGLNRSTISDLVEELANLGLVSENESTTREGIGRPSLLVTGSENVVAFSVHPELDFLAVAAVSLAGKLLLEERVAFQPGTSAQVVVREAARLIQKLKGALGKDLKIVGVGVAIPGQVRLEDGVVRLAPHLGWVEVPFAKMLEQLVNLPVFLDNDASLGCMAERLYGAARNFDDVIYLFGGSGIGGGVVTAGVQLRGSTGYACELGHVRVSDFAGSDYSGLQGTVESLVRREDLVKALKLKTVDDSTLENALLANRSASVKALVEQQIDVLGAALANYVNIFNPQVIVLAGFLSMLFYYDQERMLLALRQGSLAASREGVIVRNAELGKNLLLVAAAELPFSALIQAPATYLL